MKMLNGIALMITLVLLLQACENPGKYKINISDVGKYGFSKDEIINLGQLVAIDYVYFDKDRANFNPPLPIQKSFPANLPDLKEKIFPKYDAVLAKYRPLVNLQGRDREGSSKKEFYGHVWRPNDKKNTLVVSIRGTSDAQEWIDDAKFDKVKYSDNPEFGLVEVGFKDIFNTFTVSAPDNDDFTPLQQYLSSVEHVKKIIVVGHSLGSSLANLVAFDLAQSNDAIPIYLLTFASPYTGDHEYAEAFESAIKNSIRVVNKPDIVPRVPPRLFGFRHVWHEVEVNSKDDPKIKESIGCYHSLLTYLHLLDAGIELAVDCGANDNVTR